MFASSSEFYQAVLMFALIVFAVGFGCFIVYDAVKGVKKFMAEIRKVRADHEEGEGDSDA